MLGLSIDKNMINATILSDGGYVVSDYQTPTPADSYRDCLLAVSKAVTTLETNAPSHRPAGIALPGIMHDNIMRNAPLSWLNGKAIKQDLQAALGREIVIGGFGACFTLYEALYGAGREAETVFGMHIDANCTGGFVASGRSISGANGIAGNWAHLPLPAPVPHELDGHDCWCGRTGCTETFISAESIEQDYLKITGNRANIVTIASAAANNDIVAESTIQVLEDRLGRVTSAFITIIDPKVIVIGGVVGTMERIYEKVPRKWPGYVTARNPVNRLVQAKGSEMTAAAGAALLGRMQV